MRAIRAVGPGRIEVADVPEPVATDRVLVGMRQVGICGSDVKMLAGKVRIDYPRVLGHEGVGEVIKAPPDTPFEEGARVLIDPARSCGWCHLCIAGRRNLCRNGGLMGRDFDGVFTEIVSSPVSGLLPIPEVISFPASGLLQVLGTCVHAVRRLRLFPGQVAAVIGLGVAGQLISQLLQMHGLGVVGVTRSAWKRELAARLGAQATAEPSDAAKCLNEFTAGRGPDVVVEAVGTEATLASAVELVGVGGTVLAYGSIPGGDRGLPYYELYKKELTVHHPRAAVAGDYRRAIDLAATGELALEPIVTHELRLDDGPRAFDLVDDPSSLKVLMRVD